EDLPVDVTIDHAHDLPPIHHGNAVGQSDHLVELRGDDHHRSAAIAFFNDAGVNEFDRTDIQAPGRLGSNEQASVAGELPRKHHVLLATARQGGNRIVHTQ